MTFFQTDNVRAATVNSQTRLSDLLIGDDPDTTGNVRIGRESALFTVLGDLSVAGVADLADAVSLGKVDAAVSVKGPLNVAGPAELNNSVSLGTADLPVSVQGSLNVVGLAVLGDTVTLGAPTAAVGVQGSLNVAGPAVLGDTVTLGTLTAAVGVQGALNVAGSATLSKTVSLGALASPVSVQGAFNVAGAATLSKTVSLGAPSSPVNVQGKLNVAGEAEFNDYVKSLGGAEFYGNFFGIYQASSISNNCNNFYVGTDHIIFEITNNGRIKMINTNSGQLVFESREDLGGFTRLKSPDGLSEITMLNGGNTYITNQNTSRSVFQSIQSSTETKLSSVNGNAVLTLSDLGQSVLESKENIEVNPGSGKFLRVCGYTLPNTLGDPAQVMTSNGSGAATWTKPIAFTQTFGGSGGITDFLLVNGLFTTLALPVVSLGPPVVSDKACVFVVPTACNLVSLSFNGQSCDVELLKNGFVQASPINASGFGVTTAVNVDFQQGDQLTSRFFSAGVNASALVTCMFR